MTYPLSVHPTGKPAGGRPRSTADDAADPISSCRPVRVLLAEDETITALYAEELLIRLGYEICGVAATGPKAVVLAERTLPDIVLMDVSLAQGTDGIAAAREIRSRFDIPSVFVTAHSDARTRMRAEEAGHLGFVNKPYSSELLGPVMQSAIRRLRQDGCHTGR